MALAIVREWTVRYPSYPGETRGGSCAHRHGTPQSFLLRVFREVQFRSPRRLLPVAFILGLPPLGPNGSEDGTGHRDRDDRQDVGKEGEDDAE